jgi:hypothetical protein
MIPRQNHKHHHHHQQQVDEVLHHLHHHHPIWLQTNVKELINYYIKEKGVILLASIDVQQIFFLGYINDPLVTGFTL